MKLYKNLQTINYLSILLNLLDLNPELYIILDELFMLVQ
jgi:hypothetical protein